MIMMVNFTSVQFSDIKYTHIVEHHHHHPFTEFFSSCKNETELLNNNSPFPALLGPKNHNSTFHFYESDYPI